MDSNEKKLDAEERRCNLEYIKIQWQDIHHMYQQEFVLLATILGFIYLFDQLLREKMPGVSHELILFIGLIVSFFSAMVVLNHYQVFVDKMEIITKTEYKLGFIAENRHRFTTQLFIYLLFITILSVFIYMLVHNLNEHFKFQPSVLSLFIALIFFIIFAAPIIISSFIQRGTKKE